MVLLSRQFDLPFQPESVRAARSIVRVCSVGFAEEAVEDAELLVSEIVTNAVRHGDPVITLSVEADEDSLRVAVSDGSNVLPVSPRQVSPALPSGRGLLLVARVATEWGVATDSPGDGKTVWFRIAGRPDGVERDTLEAAWS